MKITKTNYNILADCRSELDEDIIETILQNRGIKDIDHFLNPQESDLLPLTDFKNIDKAGKIVLDGIKNNSKFGVYWDTDLDGVTSGTIMTRYLKNFTDNITTYINNGKEHGLVGQNIEKINDIVNGNLGLIEDAYHNIYDYLLFIDKQTDEMMDLV